jgi:four helix bundle protein
MKSFEELNCWKKAASLRRRVSAIVKTFPVAERHRLGDQMIRSSRSAPAQIAEGFARFHYQDNIQYCRQARGSIFELIDHFITAKEEVYISDDLYNEIRNEIDDCLALLNGYINYLARAKSTRVEEPYEVYTQLTDNN